MSALPPYRKRVADVLGSTIAYVDEGEGRPVVFLHGNPTSSYLWRRVLPHLTDRCRAIAPDLIGMGDSGKPDIGYTLDDHCGYTDAFLDALSLEHPAVLIGHDWGGVIAVRRARRDPGRVAALVLMETHLPPAMPAPDYTAMGDGADFFRQIREAGTGERMVLEDNVFVETVLPDQGVLRSLGEEEMAAYRSPFPAPDSRLPILQWAREIPIEGTPERSVEILSRNNAWLMSSPLPKLLLHARPGALVTDEVVEHLRGRATNLDTAFVGEGTHFIQEDVPDAVGQAIATWLARLDAERAP